MKSIALLAALRLFDSGVSCNQMVLPSFRLTILAAIRPFLATHPVSLQGSYEAMPTCLWAVSLPHGSPQECVGCSRSELLDYGRSRFRYR